MLTFCEEEIILLFPETFVRTVCSQGYWSIMPDKKYCSFNLNAVCNHPVFTRMLSRFLYCILAKITIGFICSVST
jgi:hypothetical protein